jgi:hypothetical protein
VEAIGVAILMGCEPSMVYGCETLEALNEFEQGQTHLFNPAAKNLSNPRLYVVGLTHFCCM